MPAGRSDHRLAFAHVHTDRFLNVHICTGFNRRDGLFAAVTVNGTVLIADGTECSVDKTVIMKSNKPLTCTIIGNTISYSADEPVVIGLPGREKVRKVYLNGEKINGWKYNSSTHALAIPLPEGHGTVKIE